MQERVRRDGVREVKSEGEVREIPHDHEIAPDALFAKTCRRMYWVENFMSIGRSDLDYVDAMIALAAARDLMAMAERMPRIADALTAAVKTLREGALIVTSPRAVEHIEADLDSQVAASAVVTPSVGPEFRDSVWYRGTDVDERSYGDDDDGVDEDYLEDEYASYADSTAPGTSSHKGVLRVPSSNSRHRT